MSDFSPLVSIVIPCRNEIDYIDVCLRSVFAQVEPPGGIEIIVVDGMSEDGTRDILEDLKTKDSRLKIVDNVSQITPCARNLGIQAARGGFIAILDAHTVYAPTYIRTCIELLNEHPEVCCVGGPITSVGKGSFGRATAAVMSNPLGVGNAKHRFPTYEGYAEGACFPVFRRNVFDDVGLFDEDLIRNQDDEFNFRIALKGDRIFLSPRATCNYYVRETPRELFWQYFQYGFYRIVVLKKHRLSISFRHFVPALFFLMIFAVGVGSVFLSGWWTGVGVILPLVYAVILCGAGLSVAFKEGMAVGLWFPISAFIVHASYALGFLWALIRGPKNRRILDPTNNVGEKIRL